MYEKNKTIQMNKEAFLGQEYYKNMAVFAELLRASIVETYGIIDVIDVEKTEKKLLENLKTNRDRFMKELRPVLMGYLNLVYLSGDLSDEFMFEFQHRLEKLVIIASILEHENFLTFGSNPNLTDCPTAIGYLMLKIKKFMKDRYMKMIEEYKQVVGESKEIQMIWKSKK